MAGYHSICRLTTYGKFPDPAASHREAKAVDACDRRRNGAQNTAMISRSPLDDPEKAAHAWARYLRIMRWMMLVTVGLVAAAVYLLYRSNGAVSIHYYIAAALGVGFTMLLASALMGLAFLSSGTGHDRAIDDRLEDERNRP